MEPPRTSGLTLGDHEPEAKAVQAADERLDSGLDSLKEEEYREVAEEIRRLQLHSEPPPQNRHRGPEQGGGPPPEWRTQRTEDGDSLLHLSIIHEAKDFTKNLIEASKDTDLLDQQNLLRQTPLHLAVITDQADVCRHLLASDCDPSLVDNRGDTPLHIACRHGNLACFSVITQFCPSQRLPGVMAACNYNGQNCLHLAAVHGFLLLVETMVRLGADVNAKEQRGGRGALHLAVDQQNLPLVRLLLKNGADPNLLTSGGHSPYHLTHGYGSPEIRQELLPRTDPRLRELPDSGSEDSEEEEEEQEEQQEEEVVGYDDIHWNGH